MKYLDLTGLGEVWANIKSYISSKIPTKTSQLQNDSNYVTTSQLPSKTSQLTNDSDFTTNAKLATKQDTINDLATIRSGASKGATAVQPSTLNNYATKSELSSKANDSDVVHNSGNEYIYGVKNFYNVFLGEQDGVIRIGQNVEGTLFCKLYYDGRIYNNSKQFVPYTNNEYYLGTASNKWKDVYATTFNGNLVGNVTGNCSGTAGGVAWTNVSGRPTKVSQFPNDSGYITSSGSCNYANSAGSAPANGGTSTASAYLNGYGTLQYGADRLQYFNINTTTTNGASNVANPTNDWYYHIIQSHGNPAGYYFDIASHFHSNSVYYRRIAAGSESGWIQFIDSGNIGSQSVNYANLAGRVAWDNVSGRPTKVSQFTNDSGYLTSGNVVDRTSNQSINGEKTFNNGIQAKDRLIVQNADPNDFTKIVPGWIEISQPSYSGIDFKHAGNQDYLGRIALNPDNILYLDTINGAPIMANGKNIVRSVNGVNADNNGNVNIQGLSNGIGEIIQGYYVPNGIVQKSGSVYFGTLVQPDPGATLNDFRDINITITNEFYPEAGKIYDYSQIFSTLYLHSYDSAYAVGDTFDSGSPKIDKWFDGWAKVAGNNLVRNSGKYLCTSVSPYGYAVTLRYNLAMTCEMSSYPGGSYPRYTCKIVSKTVPQNQMTVTSKATFMRVG